MTTLKDDVRDEVKRIYDNALRDGYVSNDDICDELGDYWDDVDESSDATLKEGYALARSAHEEEHDEAMRLLKAALDKLS